MTPKTRRLHDFLGNVWVVLVLAILNSVGGGLALYDKIQPAPGGRRWIILSGLFVGGALMVVGIIYSIRVRQENLVFRTLPERLHKINHDYRNVLSKLFGAAVVPTQEERVRAELKTLESACQKIAVIFAGMTHVPCTVTVKLITEEPDGRAFCETLVRSETNSSRDEGQPRVFQLRTGENTAFDKALMYTNGVTSRFFSGDLAKEANGYRNQRQSWDQFYRSAIVVPIRYVDTERVGQQGGSDVIGFLAVDTKSENRLNDTYHVELLASFADQMYNFMSLMRGKYGVPRSGLTDS
jgi:hypothetical protein